MTREIKFKIWDGACKCFYFPDVPEHQNNVHIFLAGNMSYGGCYLGNECVLLQYTGWKDKNGKEIWEGDVYKHRNGRIDVLDDMPQFYYDCIEYGHEGENIEVIGNIYQNPELLPKS